MVFIMLHLLKVLKEDEILTLYLEKLTDELTDLLGDDFQEMKSEIDYNGKFKTLELTFHYGNLNKHDEIIQIFEKAFAMVERCSTSFGLKFFYTNKGIEQDTKYWYNFDSDVDVYVYLEW